VNTHLPWLTPAWLTDVLLTHGHLWQGHVTTVAVTHAFETPPSTLMQLTVTYSADALATPPARLVLKLPKPHKHARGSREARFYTTVAPHMPAVPLVPCFGAGCVPLHGTPYVLLADLSATHAPLDGQPSWAHVEAMVEVMARLHAAWWDHPDLAVVAGQTPEESFAEDFGDNAACYEDLVDRLGEQLTAEHRQLFERFLAEAPALLLRRARAGHALTLCHPENHHGNFLFPSQPSGDVVVIDWHQYRCWMGPRDIVSVIDRCLALDQRHRGRELVRFYHQRLRACGVTSYPWRACWQDYRLAFVDYLGLLLQRSSAPAWVLQHLPPLLHEFDALQCATLFG